MRKTIQYFSLFLFTALFFLATYRLPDWIPADLYLRIDPLLGIGAVIAYREIILRVLWSLVLIGTTLAVGRFFCAYICPLGTVIDGFDTLLFRNKKRPELKSDAGKRQAKHILLVGVLAAAFTGVSLAYLLDPIALLTRVYTFVVYPMTLAVVNFLLDLCRPLFRGLGWVGLSHLSYPQPVYYLTAVTLLIFGIIILLNRWSPRFWCRYLCPLGAMLSLISPLGLLRRQVGPVCNQCGICWKTCPMGAIGQDPHETLTPECIQCRDCAVRCPVKAISFPVVFPRGSEYAKPDLSRRGLVSSLAGGLTLGLLSTHTPFTPLRGRKQLIRPPGALTETDFLRTCIRCGECMKSCITNTLQPSLWESGFAGLWTPKAEMRLAACEPNCHVCGRVCPTQAIRSLSLEEKTHAKIGTAILRKEMCLVWSQNKMCLICDEICPYNAIVFRSVEGIRRPVVIPSRCNGCGYCEQRCPVRGESAIVVVPDGEIRLTSGSYIAEAKKAQLEFIPDPGDDRFMLESSGTGPTGEGADRVLPVPGLPQKPKGFL